MNRNLKGLMATFDFPPVGGGMSNYYYNICKHLRPKEISVLTTKCEEPHNRCEYPFRVHRTPLNTRRTRVVYNIPRLAYWIRKIQLIEKVDFVHCGNILTVGEAVFLLNRIYRTPYILYLHGMDIYKAYIKGEKNWIKRKRHQEIVSKASLLITNSRYTAHLTRSLTGVSRETVVINPGIDPEDFNDKTPKKELVKRLKWRENVTYFLYLGRLTPRKGLDNILKAMSLLKRDGYKLHLIVAGAGDIEYYRSLSRKLGVSKDVQFLGRIEDREKACLLDIIDVLIMVSREIEETGNVEGFGIVYIEANYFGKPVIAGRSGGVEDAVEDGKTGLLVNPVDINEIKEAMKLLIARPELRRRLGTYGKRRVLSEFLWSAQVKKLREAYIEALRVVL